ncbi:hypothetical protein QBC32DRAFT_373782 [Pseudoneurospora amorphoporcata]|uniref:Uncharacterized protein n=1 Tax=Pseudoneurospora amorphoporcata TaxID=241081 RepID=A0AAN6NQT7_9PEZI|nr:hypothetical protein QBC32DRAFT_373782 [Pseudoneurospora amorphoporcata]
MPTINLPITSQQSNFDVIDKMTWWQSLFSPICTDTDCVSSNRDFLYHWAINRSYHNKLHPPLINENDMLKQIRLLRMTYADFDEQERVRFNLTRGMQIHLEAAGSSVEGMRDWIREGDYHAYLSVLEEAEHEKREKELGKWQLDDGPHHRSSAIHHQEHDLERFPDPNYYEQLRWVKVFCRSMKAFVVEQGRFRWCC